MKVLDWGAGCGTKMNYWKQKYGVHGVGLDYTWDTVRWARQHRADGVSYCWADGSRALKYFETNSFDRVVSHSALYHVMPVGTQCKVVREAVRVVKPGGIVWFGHMRSGPAIKFWKKGPWRVCPMDPSWNVTSHVHRDKRVFGGSESWYITPAAISIILFKGMPPAGAGPALNTTIPAVQSDLDSSDSQDSSAGQG
ncbi:methyltransferase [Diplonema papillatum]|nr:methyltransferase [Diplonema papillatum]